MRTDFLLSPQMEVLVILPLPSRLKPSLTVLTLVLFLPMRVFHVFLEFSSKLEPLAAEVTEMRASGDVGVDGEDMSPEVGPSTKFSLAGWAGGFGIGLVSVSTGTGIDSGSVHCSFVSFQFIPVTKFLRTGFTFEGLEAPILDCVDSGMIVELLLVRKCLVT